MTGQEFIDGAEVVSRGGAWGDPLWTFDNPDANLSIDAQGATLEDARAAALVAAETILGGVG
jgi:hypothetical protein